MATSPNRRALVALASVLALACGGAPPIETVPPAARSEHFARVAEHLRLGGHLYAYADIDGDLAKLAAALVGIALSVPGLDAAAPADVPGLLRELGLARVRALGVSSEARGPGFVNRAFYLSDPPHEGLLRMLATPPHPFASLSSAPADVDLLWEADLTLGHQADALVAVVGRFSSMAARAANDALDELAEPMELSYRDLLGMLNGRVLFAARVERGRMSVERVSMPKIEALLMVERASGLFDAADTAGLFASGFEPVRVAGARAFELRAVLPLGDYRPIVARTETGAVYAATSRRFLEEFLAGEGPRLGDAAAFRAVSAPLPSTGNALYYVSRHALEVLGVELRRLADERGAGELRGLEALLPAAEMAWAGVGRSEPDGWSQVDVGPHTHLATFAGWPLVSVGVAAAIVVPALTRHAGGAPVSEAHANVRACFTGVASAYLQHERLPPSTPWTPAAPPSSAPYVGGDPGWQAPGWREMGFELLDSHRYRYRFVNEGRAGRCEAEGDADDDGVRELYVLRVHIDENGEPGRDGDVEITNEGE